MCKTKRVFVEWLGVYRAFSFPHLIRLHAKGYLSLHHIRSTCPRQQHANAQSTSNRKKDKVSVADNIKHSTLVPHKSSSKENRYTLSTRILPYVQTHFFISHVTPFQWSAGSVWGVLRSAHFPSSTLPTLGRSSSLHRGWKIDTEQGEGGGLSKQHNTSGGNK